MFATTEELLAAIKTGEDTALELKDLRYKGARVESPHRDGIADEFAAMANSASGTFVFGVDDKTRAIVGIPADKLDVVEEWVRNVCNDLIEPQLYCRIRKLTVPGEDGGERHVIRVDIPKSLFIHKSPNGYFLRLGSSKREMSPEILARMFQQRSQARLIRFDEQIVPQAPLSCLEPSLYAKFRTPYSPAADAEFLAKLKLTSIDDEGQVRPTVSGVLLASREPREHLTNAFIQAVSYRGTERDSTRQIDARDIVGPLDEQIREACFFVKRNMRIGAVKNEMGRRDIPQYSLRAVFEAVVNAVAHRDYSIQSSKIRLHMFADRLEIFSPGAIANTMTIESMPLRQSIRNELLTSLLARCPVQDYDVTDDHFLMDRRGEGVPIILSESERLSGRRPVYRLLDESELMLTIYAAEPPHLPLD